MRVADQRRAGRNGQSDPDTSETERRPSRRKPGLLPGIIAYEGGRQSLDCTIRDLSESGARVVMPKNAIFPSRFYLINVRDRVSHEAKVIWCGASEAGLAFIATLPLTEGLDPALSFLRRMWLERAVR